MNRLLRLKERKLVQWVIAYCAGAWAFLEVLEFLTVQFSWPSSIIRVLTVVFATGVAGVFVVAWFHGEKGDQRVSKTEATLLTALLLTAVVGAVAVRNGGDDRQRHAARAAEGALDESSLAVLPFRNLSGDTAQKFFSDGFTEELSNALASVAGLRVLAPSVFAFEGKEENIRELAREFGAYSTLEGSVRRAGDQVRITARLINTRSSRQVWSANYDKVLSPANILAVQEEIARAIARALEIALLPGRTNSLPTGGTQNQEAYDAYLRGLGALAQVTREANAVAAKEFERAIALDPEFARAHSGLAFALAGYIQPRPDDAHRGDILQRAQRAAKRALQLDSTLADARVVLEHFEPNAQEKRALLAAALRHEPASRWARFFSAAYALEVMDRVRGVAIIDTLVALDPYSPWSYIMAANVRNLAGQYARADSALNRADRLSAMGFGPRPLWPYHWNRAYRAVISRDYETASRHFPNAYPTEYSILGKTSSDVLKTIAAIQRSPQDSAARRRAAVAVVQAHEDGMQKQFAAMLYLNLDDKARLYGLFERQPLEIFWFTAVYDGLRAEPRFKQLEQQAQQALKQVRGS